MIINLNLNTEDPLTPHDKVILLALAGEISLSEQKAAEVVYEASEPVQEVVQGPDFNTEVITPEEAASFDKGDPEQSQEAAPEPEKAPKKVSVTEASLKKYDFHLTDDGEVQCNHCDFVSETGRALHLHAGTHKEDEAKPERALKSVKDEPEAGVDAMLSTEPTKEDIADAEAAAAGDPDPSPEDIEEIAKEIQGAPDPVDPKELRDKVAKVATAMVAAERQPDVRKVIDELGAARVSMLAESDLQPFLDKIWALLGEADRKKFFEVA